MLLNKVYHCLCIIIICLLLKIRSAVPLHSVLRQMNFPNRGGPTGQRTPQNNL